MGTPRTERRRNQRRLILPRTTGAADSTLAAALAHCGARTDPASASVKRESTMSKSILLMTNHHRVGLFRGALSLISEVLHTWGDRSKMRRELARLSERELHDIGRSWSDIAHEVDKPFWRA
jgi:uncharacterized protein YjiS (DUF1127 family)